LSLEPPDVAIEVSRLDVHLSMRRLEDFLPDPIAVTITAGEDGEDEQFQGPEGRVGRRHRYLRL
jgi:hypothetical protein